MYTNVDSEVSTCKCNVIFIGVVLSICVQRIGRFKFVDASLKIINYVKANVLRIARNVAGIFLFSYGNF